ncbi:oxygenase MpaB family protein [Marinobacter sp. SS21]|uniref:oxygenase MpaB family protein n=1 Tax=Marinobacter sp. SS21 TaxID=2979460 RepID=UPI0023305593|nr:oxygenase MpaB family protein [Marinobacter sp. SS21]MDC0661028.1 oxygenase MpaB family protein [Marinobacter sp. SS21]
MNESIVIPAGDTGERQRRHQFSRYRRIMEHDFPLDFLIAGELAQFQTYAIPSISRLLHRTGQYEMDGVKRLDDTRATLTSIFSHPEGSRERAQMIEHLNWVHSHYSITNEDYLYTLLRLFLNPLDWNARWGWRSLTPDEIELIRAEMVSVGKAMGIEFDPCRELEQQSLASLNQWQQDYRRRHERYHPANQAVALGAIEGIKAQFPRWVRPVIPAVVVALLEDKALLAHLGLSPPTRLQTAVVRCGLGLWWLTGKIYRPWKRKPFSDGWLANHYPSYPGNRLDYCQLGPRKLINHRNATTGCPFH